eukprot:scaffold74377_cov60-Phaeocystis_antarctica.AAC.1
MVVAVSWAEGAVAAVDTAMARAKGSTAAAAVTAAKGSAAAAATAEGLAAAAAASMHPKPNYSSRKQNRRPVCQSRRNG